ncbi:MAG: hypothetical protein N2114_05990 [Candidatus Goldbacteria bacterium]|nr:hypothetical protein [Candidatus Goldiibacteriota bacterium]
MNNKIVCIFGKKGTGKTTYIKNNILNFSEYKRILIIDILDEYTILKINKIYEINKFIKNYDFSIRIIPENEEEYNFICEYIFNTENITVVFEEAAFYPVNEYILKLVRFGRHKKINQIYITQRPYDINRNITAMADEFIIFNTTEPRDLDFFKKILPPIAVEKIKTLPKYHYLKYSPSIGYKINKL